MLNITLFLQYTQSKQQENKTVERQTKDKDKSITKTKRITRELTSNFTSVTPFRAEYDFCGEKVANESLRL